MAFLAVESNYAQIQVTEFKSNLPNSVFHCFEMDSQQFITEAFCDGTFIVSDASGSKNILLINGRMEAEYFSQKNASFIGHRAIFAKDNELYVHDLINDTFTIFSLENKYEIGTIKTCSQYGLLLNLKNNEDPQINETLFYNPKSHNVDILRVSVFSDFVITEDLVFGHDFFARELFSYIPSTKTLRSIYSSFNTVESISVNNGFGYFVTISGLVRQAYSINLITSEVTNLAVDLKQEDRFIRFLKQDDELLLSVNSISGKGKVYTISGKNVVNSIKGITIDDPLSILVYSGSKDFVYKKDENLTIVDKITGAQIREFNLEKSDHSTFIEGRIIFLQGRQILSYDIEDRLIKVLDGDATNDFSRGSILEALDGSCSIITTASSMKPDIFYYNKKGEELGHYESSLSTDLGLEGESYKIGGRLFIKHINTLYEFLNTDLIEVFKYGELTSQIRILGGTFGSGDVYLYESTETGSNLYQIGADQTLSFLSNFPLLLSIKRLGRFEDNLFIEFEDKVGGVLSLDTKDISLFDHPIEAWNNESILLSSPDQLFIIDRLGNEILINAIPSEVIKRNNHYYFNNNDKLNTFNTGRVFELFYSDDPSAFFIYDQSNCINEICYLVTINTSNLKYDFSLLGKEGELFPLHQSEERIKPKYVDDEIAIFGVGSKIYFKQVDNYRVVNSFSLENISFVTGNVVSDESYYYVVYSSNFNGLNVLKIDKQDFQSKESIELSDLESIRQINVEISSGALLINTKNEIIKIDTTLKEHEISILPSFDHSQVFKEAEYLYTFGKDRSAGIQLFQFNEGLVSVDEEDISATSSIAIFPNPTEELLYIEFPDWTSGFFNIYNMAGSLVISQKYTQSKMQPIEVRGLNKGTYFIKLVDTHGEVYSTSFIKI